MKIRRVDFYPDDWISGTRELADDERGVYVTICMLIYARGGPIGVGLVKAWSSSHGNAFNRIIGRLEKLGKIARNGLEITQKRCENELERARKRVGNAEEKAAKRWNNRHLQDAAASPADDAINHHTTTNIQQPSKETRASRASSNEGFDRWWEGYPDKVGKGAARKAFSKALTKTSLDQLTAGVERYKATKPVDRPWCNPSTWLNQERWLDVPAANGHRSVPNGRLDDAGLHDGPTEPPPEIAGWELPLGRSH